MAGGVQFLRSFYNGFKKIVIDRCVVLYGSPWSSGESQPERRKSGRAMAAHFLGIRLGELFLPEPSALLPHVRPLGAGHARGKAYSWPRQAPVETTRPADRPRLWDLLAGRVARFLGELRRKLDADALQLGIDLGPGSLRE
jgi:hypothetical protein